LNDYMLAASKSGDDKLAAIRTSLEIATALAAKTLDSIGNYKRSLTFVEGILVGVLSNLATAPNPNDPAADHWAKERAAIFQRLPAFDDGARYALSNAQTVKERLRQSVRAFA
jgi:hypothetical protein